MAAQRSVAGAVAAAARELRPVELVGLYESQKEVLEQEVATAKAEVGPAAPAGLQEGPGGLAACWSVAMCRPSHRVWWS